MFAPPSFRQAVFGRLFTSAIYPRLRLLVLRLLPLPHVCASSTPTSTPPQTDLCSPTLTPLHAQNPVWNQSFKFNIINENDVSCQVMDEDTMAADDCCGVGRVDLARVRVTGSDRQQVHIIRGRNSKQHGIVQVSLTFQRNAAMAGIPGAVPYGAVSGYMPAPSGHYPYGAPSGYYGAPSGHYGAPSGHYGAPSGHYHPAPQPMYHTAPAPMYAPAPPSHHFGHPPAMPNYAAAPSPYSAPPSQYAPAYPAPAYA
jgi:hypothetical protein